jgi:uncharacterized protein (TIGR03435 family)
MSSRIAVLGVGLLGILPFAHAQSGDRQPTFDVVSVKPTTLPAPDGRGNLVMQRTTGGPGSSDPGRIHYPYISLKSLLMEALQVKGLQIEGPDWLSTERFDIAATMPPSTTQAQFRLMLQSLLADRFHLTYHRETREVPVYLLTVAKGGPKLKPSGSAAPPEEPAPAPSGAMVLTQAKSGADGFPSRLFPAGKPGLISLLLGARARLAGQLQTTGDLAAFLTNFLGKPVTDGTNLQGKYDFTFDFAANSLAPVGPADASDEGSSLPDFFAALQNELGLRLESKKGPLEIIAIDHIDKKPTEN